MERQHQLPAASGQAQLGWSPQLQLLHLGPERWRVEMSMLRRPGPPPPATCSRRGEQIFSLRASHSFGSQRSVNLAWPEPCLAEARADGPWRHLMGV